MNVKATVDRLFRDAPDRRDWLRVNPVTGAGFNGRDPIKQQKEAAYRVLAAREWFDSVRPADAPPLPLSYSERESLKVGGLSSVVAWFARSLENLNYDFNKHPSFDDYARGVLASPIAPDLIKTDQGLISRYPPNKLYGLEPGLYWESAWPLASIRRAPRYQQQQFLLGPPPQYVRDFIPRTVPNVPDGYAPGATHFLQLTDEFIAHATKCAPHRRLPRRWSAQHFGEAYFRFCERYRLRVIYSDNGWLIERDDLVDGDEEVLSNFFMSTPVLCPTSAVAARLAEACLHSIPSEYLLHWADRT
jgi:hypothetical protein